jgi:tripartite ATP-independent transporter DctM subunit
MSVSTSVLENSIPDTTPGIRLRYRLHALENTVLAILLTAMVLIPMTEIVLRATLGFGIQGAIEWILHLTLVAAMLGAAVAAREGRLLAFATATLLHGQTKKISGMFSAIVSVAVTAILCQSGIEFVQSEYTGGNFLAYGIPVWIFDLALPAGFALIFVRLAMRATDKWTGGLCVLLAGLAGAGIWLYAPVDPQVWMWPALIIIGVATVFGAPVFISIAGVALTLLAAGGVPMASMALDHYTLTSNSSLPAIPLFSLAGFLLAESGAPVRLIALFNAAFGRYRSGAAVVAVLSCTLFTSFTGASGIAILALGGLLLPLLRNTGYTEKNALTLITGGGLPGTILLPALPLILYAIVARVSIEDMFLGGILPVALMFTLVLAWGISQRPRHHKANTDTFNLQKLLDALWKAKWELALPVIPVTALFTGLATPLEAAAVTAFYVLIVTTLINRDLSIRRDLPRVMAECGLLVGGILLILGVALGLTNFMVDARIPDRAVEWVTTIIHNRWLFLLALNGFLLFIGCFMDIYSAIIVVAPLVVPIGLAFGIHPVHLGITFLANMELGYLTPPVGMNLFYASSRFNQPMLKMCRAVIPLLGVLAMGVLMITYIPWLSTGLLGILR